MKVSYTVLMPTYDEIKPFKDFINQHSVEKSDYCIFSDDCEFVRHVTKECYDEVRKALPDVKEYKLIDDEDLDVNEVELTSTEQLEQRLCSTYTAMRKLDQDKSFYTNDEKAEVQRALANHCMYLLELGMATKKLERNHG